MHRKPSHEPGCVSHALESTWGDIAKSLACKKNSEGADEGTDLRVHRGSTSGQCDTSIKERENGGGGWKSRTLCMTVKMLTSLDGF